MLPLVKYNEVPNKKLGLLGAIAAKRLIAFGGLVTSNIVHLPCRSFCEDSRPVVWPQARNVWNNEVNTYIRPKSETSSA